MKRNMIYQLNSQKLVLGSVIAIISFLREVYLMIAFSFLEILSNCQDGLT